MHKTIIAYGLAAATGACALQWLEFQYAVRTVSTEPYVVVIATVFTGIGMWAGNRLTAGRDRSPVDATPPLPAELGISDREFQVLQLLVKGHSNKEIARNLFVSPNTVKTHLARIYGKLDVSRRTQAIYKARALGLFS